MDSEIHWNTLVELVGSPGMADNVIEALTMVIHEGPDEVQGAWDTVRGWLGR